MKPHTFITEHDIVRCALPEKKPAPTFAKNVPLTFLFEDESMLVIDKPPGIVVHEGSGPPTQSVVSLLMAAHKNLSVLSPNRPGIVHRLDKDTSGILIVAKTNDAHRRLAQQWLEREVKKEYTALVAGSLVPARGRIEAPIGRSKKDRKRMWVTRGKQGKESITEYRVLRKIGSEASLVKLMPLTGRTHQIRVHLSSIYHPIIGDSVYGDAALNKKFEQEYGLQRQFLHASKLTLKHPVTGKKLVFNSQLPEDLLNALNNLQITAMRGAKRFSNEPY